MLRQFEIAQLVGIRPFPAPMAFLITVFVSQCSVPAGAIKLVFYSLIQEWQFSSTTAVLQVFHSWT